MAKDTRTRINEPIIERKPDILLDDLSPAELFMFANEIQEDLRFYFEPGTHPSHSRAEQEALIKGVWELSKLSKEIVRRLAGGRRRNRTRKEKKEKE